MSEELRKEFESNTGRRLVWNRSAWAEYATIIESALLREREENTEIYKLLEEGEGIIKQGNEVVELFKVKADALEIELFTANDRIKELEAQIEEMRCCQNCKHKEASASMLFQTGYKKEYEKNCMICKKYSHWQPKGEKQ